MKILFIDDNGEDVRSPLSPGFRSAIGMGNGDVTIALSSGAALDAIKNSGPFDQIWFDHDLAERDGVEDTAMPVAHYLAEQVFDGNIIPRDFATIYIHTQNPVGRDNLNSVLTRWGFEVRHRYW